MERSDKDILGEAFTMADIALNLAPDNYLAHYARARVHFQQGEMDQSLIHFERAIQLNPPDSGVLVGMSVPLLYVGQNKRAIEILLRAKAIDPLHGRWLLWQQGWAYWQTSNCQKGLDAMLAMANPPLTSQRMMAGIYACLGQKAEANAAFNVFLDKRPNWNMDVKIASLGKRWTVQGAVCPLARRYAVCGHAGGELTGLSQTGTSSMSQVRTLCSTCRPPDLWSRSDGASFRRGRCVNRSPVPIYICWGSAGLKMLPQANVKFNEGIARHHGKNHKADCSRSGLAVGGAYHRGCFQYNALRA